MTKLFKNKIDTIILKDKLFKSLIHGSFYNLISALIALLLGFLINLLIARNYGSEILGQFSLINSIFSIVIIFALLGTNTAILRLIPEHLVKYSKFSAYNIFLKTVKIVFLLSIIISLILFIFSPYLLSFLNYDKTLIPLLKISSIFIIFNSLYIIFIASIRALDNVKIYAFLQALLPISNLLILSFFIFFTKNDNAAIYSWLFSYFVLFLISLYFVLKCFKHSKDDNVVLVKSKNILSTSIPMFLTTTVVLIIAQIDILMLGSYKDENIVGIYTIVAKLAILTNFILITVNTIIGPKFSKLYYENKHLELKKLLKKSSILIFFSSLPIVLFLIFFGEFILIQFGNEFVLGYKTLVILTIGYGILLISGPIEMFLNMTGYQKTLNYIYLFGGFMNITLNYILIPKYSMIGAAIATFFSLLTVKLIILIFIKYKF